MIQTQTQQKSDFHYLPGTLAFFDAGKAEYDSLARYHYRSKPPATWALVRAARFGSRRASRVVAVGVLSWPVPMVEARLQHFGLKGSTYRACLMFANQNVRTISRIIVHPQFRGIGLASEIARQLIERAPTRYVEASAVMGRYARFLERAGMSRFDAPNPEKPAYFLVDRAARDTQPSDGALQ